MGVFNEPRAIAARYEKLAVHYLALVKISMIRRLGRRLSDRQTKPGERERTGRPHSAAHPGQNEWRG